MWFLASFTILMQYIIGTHAANILLVPLNSLAHATIFYQLGNQLAQNGHQATMLIPSNAHFQPWPDNTRVEIITYHVTAPEPYMNSDECNQLMVECAMHHHESKFFTLWKQLAGNLQVNWNNDCEDLLRNERLIEQLIGRRFDAAVMELAGVTCSYVLPYKLGIPWVTMGGPFYQDVYRNPSLPSFIPSMSNDYSDDMTFYQRLVNSLHVFAAYAFMNKTTYYSETYAPERPIITPPELVMKSSFWFSFEDSVVSYPRPKMPNMIEMGDVMARPGNPLDRRIAKFIDDSDGTILISFGPYFDHVPTEVLNKFCDVIPHMNQSIIWQLKVTPPCHLSDRVMLLDKIPQNDILASPKVKLLVTNGALTSVMEAVNHKTPMVIMPLTFDQPSNAESIQRKNIGARLDIVRFTSAELLETMLDTMHNTEIRRNIERASSIINNRLNTPGQRASFWVDHVLTYGDQHLRSGAYKLSILAFYMIDIYFFVSFVAFVFLLLCCGISYIVYKALKHRIVARYLSENTKTKVA